MTESVEQIHDCLEVVSGLYQRLMDRRAIDYCDSRGISEESRFVRRIGMAPDSWDYIAGESNVPRELLLAAGVIGKSDSGFYDRFRGRLIFPIQLDGAIIALAVDLSLGIRMSWVANISIRPKR